MSGHGLPVLFPEQTPNPLPAPFERLAETGVKILSTVIRVWTSILRRNTQIRLPVNSVYSRIHDTLGNIRFTRMMNQTYSESKKYFNSKFHIPEKSPVRLHCDHPAKNYAATKHVWTYFIFAQNKLT